MKINFLIISVLFLSCSSPKAPYQRREWKHWIDKDKNCRNTRNEILLNRSLLPVSFDSKGCRVIKGKWEDYYFPEIHFKSNQVDIDHLIPLKHAHESGGSQWSLDLKKRFANDPDNLVITNKRYNRQKGAKGIDEWLPLHKKFACRYISDWVQIKHKYQLSFSKSENRTIQQSDCAISRR